MIRLVYVVLMVRGRPGRLHDLGRVVRMRLDRRERGNVIYLLYSTEEREIETRLIRHNGRENDGKTRARGRGKYVFNER